MNPLFVPELFHYILDYLATSPSGCSETHLERKTLAALAQTCAAFSKPSLDRLWRRLDSLLPLVRTVADIVDENIVKVPLELHHLHTNSRYPQIPPSPQEWLVINRYSTRVRELTLGTERLSLHFLECAHPALPNLKVLRWEHQSRTVTTDGDMTSLGSLLTSKIVTLEVALNSPPDSKIQSFLENFTLLSPNLKSIRFDFFLLSGHSRATMTTLSTLSTQALSRAICSHRDWHRVELSCAIDDVALTHLGLSSALTVASVVLDPEAIRPDEGCFGRSDIPFRNVTSLALTVWHRLDVATHLLRPHDQAFHAFKVTLRNTQTTIMDVHALLVAIVSPRRICSLRSLVVRRSRRHRHIPMPAKETQGLSYETLRPIVSLVHLRELNITLNYPIMIDDDEFAGLVSNWPCLEVFRLMGRCDESAKTISLKGLLSLLAACPKLHEIGLSLDAQQVPSDDTSVPGSADLCRPSVTRLCLQDSPVKSPEAVAKFLLGHFPRLRRVTTGFRMLPPPQHRKFMQLWVRVNVSMRRIRLEV